MEKKMKEGPKLYARKISHTPKQSVFKEIKEKKDLRYKEKKQHMVEVSPLLSVIILNVN